MNTMTAKQMMSDSKFYMGYSRWVEETGAYETWEQSVARVMNMHRERYANVMTPELETAIAFAQTAYENKTVLGSQRSLQFGGEQLFKHNAKLYNCSSSHCDRLDFFQECMYLLLCGVGVGFSVQKQHISQLQEFNLPSALDVKVFTPDDSIEGWADCFGVLLSSYSAGAEVPFPEYQGKTVHFDYSKIRPRGAHISGGFKAPSHEGLQSAIEKSVSVLKQIANRKMKPIEAYDIIMHMADAVLSGGVRRSATICMFSPDDKEMMKAKTGNWFIDNPQRGRSNNSVVLVRGETSREDFAEIMKSVKDFGEPAFIFVDDAEFTVNPCVEVGMLPKTEDGRSGFQMCNLTELNGGAVNSVDDFFNACTASAILGTLQAGYTDFKYLSSASKEITDREALLGCSITGFMNSPEILFNPEVLEQGANLIKVCNKRIAKMIGINPASRCTVVKPSGNASVLLGTASGIHGEHSKNYFRNVQMTKGEEVTVAIQETNPAMIEDSVWSANGTDSVVSFPITTKDGSIYKADSLGVNLLDKVKLVQQSWIEAGTDVDLCVDKRLRHNVSNTITVDDWDAVEQYIFDNQDYFAGVSLLASAGDKAYVQAPFTEVLMFDEIVEKYGDASLFASGLIVDGLHAFNNNLWKACDTALGYGVDLTDETSENALQRDWVRRSKKFADNYFSSNQLLLVECLKDLFNYHKWVKINQNFKPVDFKTYLKEKTFVDVDTLGGQGCSGGACEVAF